jgi:hypothetical protein
VDIASQQDLLAGEFWFSPSASLIRDLTVATQRPQLGLHPKQRYTAPAVRGPVSAWIDSRTLASERTLQEQMITGHPKAIEADQTTAPESLTAFQQPAPQPFAPRRKVRRAFTRLITSAGT